MVNFTSHAHTKALTNTTNLRKELDREGKQDPFSLRVFSSEGRGKDPMKSPWARAAGQFKEKTFCGFPYEFGTFEH